jgi:biotin transport system substrate-specific component
MSALPSAVIHPGPGITLADALLPTAIERAPAWARDTALVLAATGLLVLGAYVSLAVPAVQLGQLYVPVNDYVPLTLQTFGVLFTGALLGARRGLASTGLYLLLGILGLPVFAAGSDGVHRAGVETIASLQGGRLVLGATGGYLLGFLLASAVVGGLAQRGWDRRLSRSLVAMTLGSALIYACGVAWLAVAADLPPSDALDYGLWPFLPGDLLKLAAAAALLPLGWRLVAARASDMTSGTHPTPRDGGRAPGPDLDG